MAETEDFASFTSLRSWGESPLNSAPLGEADIEDFLDQLSSSNDGTPTGGFEGVRRLVTTRTVSVLRKFPTLPAASIETLNPRTAARCRMVGHFLVIWEVGRLFFQVARLGSCFDSRGLSPSQMGAVAGIGLSTLLATPAACAVCSVVLLRGACTSHLRSIAIYSVLNYFCIAFQARTFAEQICDNGDKGIAKAITMELSFIFGGLLKYSFMRINQHRLDILEMNGVGHDNHTAWHCLFHVIRFLYFCWIICSASVVLKLFGRHVFELLLPAIDVVTVAIGFVFFVWMCMALRELYIVRRLALEAARIATGRQAKQCSLAARAALHICIGILFGAITTILRWLSFILAIKEDRKCGASFYDELLTMQSVFADIPRGCLFMWSVALAGLDAISNSLSAMFIAGVFSKGFRQVQVRASVEEKRLGLWKSAGTTWSPHSCDEWQEKVAELGQRGFTLEALLRFYRSLGHQVMLDYNPRKHTTADVVRQAVIPLSAERRCALATIMMNGEPTRPEKMVTHNWSNKFRDLVAAVCADALGEEEYGRVAWLLMRDVAGLHAWLRAVNKLSATYWVCAFSVNQHVTICGTLDPVVDSVTRKPHPVCDCGSSKVWNDTAPTLPTGESIGCEVNKFDDMMKWLSCRNPEFEQVVAIDADFSLFSRAWCVAELAAAQQMGMRQRLKLRQAEHLDAHKDRLRALRIENMQASRPEDKEEILSRIGDTERFDRELQRLLFEELLPGWLEIDANEQMARLATISRWQHMAQHMSQHSHSRGLWRADTSLTFAMSMADRRSA